MPKETKFIAEQLPKAGDCCLLEPNQIEALCTALLKEADESGGDFLEIMFKLGYVGGLMFPSVEQGAEVCGMDLDAFCTDRYFGALEIASTMMKWKVNDYLKKGASK